MRSSALFSPCGRYRYRLMRTWSPGPRVLWVMLNPSTADAERNDPTIRRCIGFSRSWGYGGLIAVNLFAFRATRPADLWRAEDPVGPANDRHIRAAAGRCEMIIVAWGAFPRAADRGLALVNDLKAPHCLSLTLEGHPRHPLHSPGNLRPRPFAAGAAGQG